MIYQALLLSAIGTDQDHFPVVLAAAVMVCTLSPVLIPFSKIVPYGIPLADERTTREAQVSSTGLMMTKPKTTEMEISAILTPPRRPF